MVTSAQRSAAFQVVAAVAEAIRALGSVPSGHFYSRLLAMPLLSQMTADQYRQLIGTLKSAGLVEENNHLLTWIGPSL